MTCHPTAVPAAETLDIPALRAKYAAERDKRLNTRGQEQYVPGFGSVSGEMNEVYATDPHTSVEQRDPISEDLDVLILGGGFGGLLAAYHLTQQGVTNFRNVDHAGDFGGVWYWNRYPGIQCDNDAYCYLPLLEETGYLPSKKFADGAEIYAHCKRIAETFGFADKAVFHTLITSLQWDAKIARWRVGTSRGDEFRARFVVMACGVLNMPKLPGIPGIDSFKGKMFHTARWDYGYTGGSHTAPVLDRLKDKRVAILGTGATAIQAVPHLAKYAQQLYVIQRTPSNVDERPNPPTDPDWAASLERGWQAARQDNFHRAAMEFFQPGEQDLICDIWTEIARNLQKQLAAEGWPELTAEEFLARREAMDFQVMERMRQRVEAIVTDPKTAEALKPWFRFLCKRPLSNNEYYPAFNQPGVKLIDVSATHGLEAMTERGFMHEGEEIEVDCMIFASGFEVTSDLERRWGIPVVEGRGGVSLYDHWREGPVTLHGTMTHGFPNQFFVGFIQGGINATVTEQFGRQGQHIAHIVAEALKRGAEVVEPTREAQDTYVARFEELEPDTSAFTRECTPSYFNNEGEEKAKWALFRPWGLGWHNFQAMLAAWRETGDMAGLEVKGPALVD
jgi:cation diffusion facilitator CzcD-associated flavoprotein CzcO